jgi:hypothetical protein
MLAGVWVLGGEFGVEGGVGVFKDGLSGGLGGGGFGEGWGLDRLDQRGLDRLDQRGLDRLDQRGLDRLDQRGLDRLDQRGSGAFTPAISWWERGSRRGAKLPAPTRKRSWHTPNRQNVGASAASCCKVGSGSSQP